MNIAEKTAKFTVAFDEFWNFAEQPTYIPLDCTIMGQEIGFVSTGDDNTDNYFKKNINIYLEKSNLGDELSINKLVNG